MADIYYLYEAAVNAAENAMKFGNAPERPESAYVTAAVTEAGNLYTAFSRAYVESGMQRQSCSEYEVATLVNISGESRIIALISVGFLSRQVVVPCDNCCNFLIQLNPQNINCEVATSPTSAVTLQQLLSRNAYPNNMGAGMYGQPNMPQMMNGQPQYGYGMPTGQPQYGYGMPAGQPQYGYGMPNQPQNPYGMQNQPQNPYNYSQPVPPSRVIGNTGSVYGGSGYYNNAPNQGSVYITGNGGNPPPAVTSISIPDPPTDGEKPVDNVISSGNLLQQRINDLLRDDGAARPTSASRAALSSFLEDDDDADDNGAKASETKEAAPAPAPEKPVDMKKMRKEFAKAKKAAKKGFFS